MLPAIIHQIWIQGRDALPRRYEGASKRWQAINPGWQYMLWDDRSLRHLMAWHAPQWLAVYLREKDPVARADVGRYAVLQHHGGLYADMDTECVRPVRDFLAMEGAALRVQLYENLWVRADRRGVAYERVANSIIASEPGHGIWTSVLEEIGRRKFDGVPVVCRTGPVMFWPLVQSLEEQQPGSVEFIGKRRIFTSCVAPRLYMHWYGWTRRSVCILDFNDSGRRAVERSLAGLFHCSWAGPAEERSG